MEGNNNPEDMETYDANDIVSTPESFETHIDDNGEEPAVVDSTPELNESEAGEHDSSLLDTSSTSIQELTTPKKDNHKPKKTSALATHGGSNSAADAALSQSPQQQGAGYVSPYSQKSLVEEDKSPIKDFLSKRKQQLQNQKEIQSRIEKNQRQKAEMSMYAGSAKSLDDINITMGLDIITARNYELTSLKGLDVRPELKSLNLHYNFLVSFKDLETQPLLEEIHAPMNTICSFHGFSFQPKLKWVNLNGNPIVRHGLYRVMCLLVGNMNIKTIGKNPVLTKEKKIAENYLSIYPQVRDALRAGWLIDLDSHPKCELIEDDEGGKPFASIIKKFQNQDMDSAESIKQTEQFKKLIAGEYGYKLEDLEKFIAGKVKIIRKSSNGVKKKASKEVKIKSLKKKIEKLKIDLKQQRSFSQQQMDMNDKMRSEIEESLRKSIESSLREQLREPLREQLREQLREEITKEVLASTGLNSNDNVNNANDISNVPSTPDAKVSLDQDSMETPQKRQNSILTVDDIVYFDVLQCHSFTYVYQDQMTVTEKKCSKVRIQFSVDAIIVITQDDLAECEILYSDILKNGFFLGDTGLARIRISLLNGDSVNLFTKQSGLARSAFKALHMFIEAHKYSIKPLTSPGFTPGSIVRSYSKGRLLDNLDDTQEDIVPQSLEAPTTPQVNNWLDENTTSPETEEYMTIEKSIISSIQSEIDGRSLPQIPADPEYAAESDIIVSDDVYSAEVDGLLKERDALENIQDSEELVDYDQSEASLAHTNENEEGLLEQSDSAQGYDNDVSSYEIVSESNAFVVDEEVNEGERELLTEGFSEGNQVEGVVIDDATAEGDQVTAEGAVEGDQVIAEGDEAADQDIIASYSEEGAVIYDKTLESEIPDENEDLEIGNNFSEGNSSYSESIANRDDGADEGDGNIPTPHAKSTIIEAPVLRNRKQAPVTTSNSVYESPKLRAGEDTEEMLLAKEEREKREREMMELYEAFQKVALEYGKERASEWLKEELSSLTPQERMRKELEVLERFHFVKEAKKLFEKKLNSP